jgi:hypothetical protein
MSVLPHVILSFCAVTYAIIPIIGWMRDKYQDSRGQYGSIREKIGLKSIGDESGPSWGDDNVAGEKKLVQEDDDHDGATLVEDYDENDARFPAGDSVDTSKAKAKET